MIKAAPKSFATVAVIMTAVIWAAINWSYSAVLSGRDSQIAALRDQIADYVEKLKGQSPDQAEGQIETLRDQLKETKKQLEAYINPPRDKNSIYQNGTRIGIVANPKIDTGNKTVVFDAVTVSGELDTATNVEFRTLVLAFEKSDGFNQARMGLAATTTYQNAKFFIVGNRTN